MNMFRPASRTVLRATASSSIPARVSVGRRFASTSPVNARRSWKGSALRWGIAVAGIYYYNTSPVFAEQPQSNLLNPNLESFEDIQHDHSSIEELTARRKPKGNAAALHSAADALSSENASTTVAAAGHEIPLDTDNPDGAAVDGEQEPAFEGAFNPETGEINWDCSCLGGMAHGPCGPEFKEAFSCFVFSNEEPKGMECIDKFQNMQQCFQRHPEVYKGELEDDEELDAELEGEREKLVSEIAERKAAQQQEEGSSQRRLLEEPATVSSMPTKSTTKKAKAKAEKDAGPPASATKQASEAKTSTSSESSTNAETAHEAPSKTVRKPTPPPQQDSAIPGEDLVPRAAFDARDNSGVPQREEEKQ